LEDKVYITRTEPEVALVLWQVRVSPTAISIKNEPGMVCDQCNKSLDWEPFAVIDLPSKEELNDPEYVPIGSHALCQACAKEFYHLTRDDVGKVKQLWFCYDCVEHSIG
jgi:hypothetical protein